MKISKYTSLLFCIVGLATVSCNNDGNAGQNHGPIILGDSSTIVTETDSQHLRDMVVDFQPAQEAVQPVKETPAAVPVAKDTVTPVPAEKPVTAAAEPAGNGLKVAFKEVTFFIPDIVTRSYTNQNPQTSNGASYQLTGGKLAGNTLQLTSQYKISRVAMRYQVAMSLKNSLGELDLPSLGFTSQWVSMTGKNNSYPIVLNEKQMQDELPDIQDLRKAVQKAVRHMNRKTAQEWLNSVQKMRSVHAKDIDMQPRYIVLLAEGKDGAGRLFNKQLRIDLPQ